MAERLKAPDSKSGRVRRTLLSRVRIPLPLPPFHVAIIGRLLVSCQGGCRPFFLLCLVIVLNSYDDSAAGKEIAEKYTSGTIAQLCSTVNSRKETLSAMLRQLNIDRENF